MGSVVNALGFRLGVKRFWEFRCSRFLKKWVPGMDYNMLLLLSLLESVMFNMHLFYDGLYFSHIRLGFGGKRLSVTYFFYDTSDDISEEMHEFMLEFVQDCYIDFFRLDFFLANELARTLNLDRFHFYTKVFENMWYGDIVTCNYRSEHMVCKDYLLFDVYADFFLFTYTFIRDFGLFGRYSYGEFVPFEDWVNPVGARMFNCAFISELRNSYYNYICFEGLYSVLNLLFGSSSKSKGLVNSFFFGNANFISDIFEFSLDSARFFYCAYLLVQFRRDGYMRKIDKKSILKCCDYYLNRSILRFGSKLMDVSYYNLNYFDVTSSLLVRRIVCELGTGNFELAEIVDPLFNEVSIDVTGLKIVLSGRFTREQRAEHRTMSAGKLALSSLWYDVDYYWGFIPLKFGDCSIRIWICRHYSCGNDGDEFLKVYNSYVQFYTKLQPYKEINKVRISPDHVLYHPYRIFLSD